MANPPAFQFYAADYLASSKVQRMSLEAEGAYIRLLAYSWQDGWIPTDLAKLARMCKCSLKKMTSLWEEHLSECFVSDGAGHLVNERLEGVRKALLDFKANRSQAGSSGAAKRWHSHSSAIAEPLANDSIPVSISISNKREHTPASAGGYSDDFERFWAAYPKKTGKGDAFKSWKKNGHPGIDHIVAVLELAKKSTGWLKENGEYIPNPSTWLNQKRWDDEYSGTRAKPEPRLVL